MGSPNVQRELVRGTLDKSIMDGGCGLVSYPDSDSSDGSSLNDVQKSERLVIFLQQFVSRILGILL